MPKLSTLTASAMCACLALLMTAAPALPQASRALAPHEGAWLDAHNAARAEVGLAPLAWSDALAADAARWAEHLAARDRFEHAAPHERAGQGENLWRGTRARWSPAETIGFFLAEKRDFRPGTFPDISRTGRWSDVGHYSQIIWPATREVGCAMATNRRDEVLVCRYWPAGNVWGERLDLPGRLTRR